MKSPALLALPLQQAVQRLALAQLDAAAAACARISDRDDAGALHDFRVALRRLRSVLRAYATWYDPVPKNLHKRLHRLARATNEARDTEVQIEWLRRVQPRLKAGARSGLTWLIERLAKRHRIANRAVRKLAHKDFAALEPRLRAALRTRKQARDAEARVTFAQATDERLSVYCAEFAADLANIGSAADREEIHAARISGKRLRYLLEPLCGSVAGVAAQVSSMKSFQDRFGELNDRFVMAREIAQAVEIAGAQADQVLPGLVELAAWVERDVKRRFHNIRVHYLGRRARKLLAPMSVLSGRLVAASDLKPCRVRLK
jgi:CHAD domain-containing protein